MFVPLLAAAPVDSALPGGFWLLLAAACGLAALAGFFGGMVFAGWREERTLRLAVSTLPGSVQSLQDRLDAARKLCVDFDRFSDAAFSSEQVERLERSSGGLIEQLTKLLESRRPHPAPENGQTLPWDPSTIQWVVTPEDRHTSLPDADALEANLQTLLREMRGTPYVSGLLLVRLDRFDQLKERYGMQARTLLRRFALVLSRAVRETDLVCQGESAETFAILLPATDAETGERLAAAVGKTLKSYRFRLEEDGPEILLSASLGYTVFRDGDHVDFALNRALHALQRSERLGRNQLHLHDGVTVAHCGAVV